MKEDIIVIWLLEVKYIFYLISTNNVFTSTPLKAADCQAWLFYVTSFLRMGKEMLGFAIKFLLIGLCKSYKNYKITQLWTSKLILETALNTNLLYWVGKSV